MESLIYEVFLVLHPVSSRLGELGRGLASLIEGESPFHDLDVYHRGASDTAVVALRYDERAMGGDDARRLSDIARGAGLTLVDPARLGPDERRAFFDVRLAQFELIARGLSRATDAMMVLADRMAIPTDRGDQTPPPAGYQPVGRMGSPARLVVQVPPLPPLPSRARPTARGTAAPPRPPTLPPPPELDAGHPRGKAKRRNNTVDDRLALSLGEQAKQARRAAEAALRAPYLAGPQTPTDIAGPDTQPVHSGEDLGPVPIAVHHVETQRLEMRPGSEPGTHDSNLVLETVPPFLDVRFLRGSEWVPVRARALSARGAYIVTGAPARLGDTVHVSVSCAGRTALVRGTVYHVTTADDAVSTGASGFAVRFPEYACAARTHLVQVLLAARNAGITLRPPPNRTAVRFPVRWPVQCATTQAQFRAEAYDVSAGGMFLATPRPLEIGHELRFAMPLDLAGTPIEGVARVSRVLGADAAARGMKAGAGVQIASMSDVDRAAWDQFLSRVRRRTEKRVLVGAAPGRVEELAAGLNAAGYTVTAGSDLGLLMRVAELDPCPPDLAVIDAEFDQNSAPSGWIEQVFASRSVQCVTVRGDVRRARSLVDRALLVES